MTQPIAGAYLSRKADALAFLPRPFWEEGERLRSAEDAARIISSPSLSAILKEQAHRWGADETSLASIHALQEPGTIALVTGQQVGLFLGPLYTIYKAASVLLTARQLQKETGRRTVPIFWLQTEDHDLPEIATCFLPRAGHEPLPLSLPVSEDELTSRISIAHRRLPSGFSALLSTLRSELGFLAHAPEILAAIEDAYTPGRSLSEAFARLLAWFFAGEGLILLDPRTPAIAKLAAPLHRRALSEAKAIHDALDERSRRLEEAGFRVQIPLRSEACLSFFHPDGPAGPRFRLLFHPEGYTLSGRADPLLTQEALFQKLEEEPLSFSTSALLRPLLQDTLLPTAAYLGGPGEISYFAQLSPLYDLFQRPMPLILPRGRFLLLEEAAAKALADLSLSSADLALPQDGLFQRLQAQRHSEPLSPERLKLRLLTPLFQTLDALQIETEALDPDLKKGIEKGRRGFEEIADKLIGRIQRARLTSDEALQKKLLHLKQRLWPHSEPQERVLGFPFFAARYGAKALKEAIFQAFLPFTSDLREIRL